MRLPPGAVLSALGAALALSLGLGTARAADPSPADASPPIDQVTVSASKYDQRTLERVILPRFVHAHSVPTAAIQQLARWHFPVCPGVTGLKPEFNEQVRQRILTTALSIGAQTEPAGSRCGVNIEVVFTPEPQGLLSHIEQHFPWLLGSARTPHDTTFSRPVQSWYTTGSHALWGHHPPVVGLNNISGQSMNPSPEEFPPTFRTPGLQPDPPYGGATAPGLAGSRMGAGLRSELLHVLVIVDAQKLAGRPLPALADYITMIGLTRMTALDTCNELPSIIDLLANGCGERAPPAALTPADAAFLKALYASALEQKGNIEEGEVRDRMMGFLQKAR